MAWHIFLFGGRTAHAQCSMHNAQCTMHNAQCTMHNAQCACTMLNAQCTMHNAQCSMLNAQCSMRRSLICVYVSAVSTSLSSQDVPTQTLFKRACQCERWKHIHTLLCHSSHLRKGSGHRSVLVRNGMPHLKCVSITIGLWGGRSWPAFLRNSMLCLKYVCSSVFGSGVGLGG
jgi:hypothetical protein